MTFKMQLSQKLTQKLTTEQLHHLEILQLSNMELEDYIYHKANENPLLTVVETEVNHVHYLMDLSITHTKSNSFISNNQKTDLVHNLLIERESSFNFLFEQIPLNQDLSEKDIKILKYLIYNLNENYYLDIEPYEVSNIFNIDVEYVEGLVDLLQRFEPIGIGSRNLKEYLLIQINNDLLAPPLASEFVKNHLEEVAKLSIKFLSKHYKISTKETRNILKFIQNLNSMPYVQQSPTYVGHIVPDVTVEKSNSEWLIIMNDQLRSSIEINQQYVDMLKSNKEDEAYCRNCLKDIMLLTQGIEQRNRTLYIVTRLLLVMQDEFFDYGIKALKPVRLKDVALALDLHESTISRSLQNKYIKTPHGIHSFRSLFVKGIKNQLGKMNSVMDVKCKINELIAKEDKKSPLTDKDLTTLIQMDGIQISRRTIAKYREELNIPNSSKRIYLYQ
ncbi:RNA polymerase factor sigma-54 [Peribacillus sp. NPDC097264]|uniref:RNA polymerase factor sigma-54 n=1 Tax=Peribacillus sp. NPDC097264 TaxID=3390616 RepID=UPI003D015EC7